MTNPRINDSHVSNDPTAYQTPVLTGPSIQAPPRNASQRGEVEQDSRDLGDTLMETWNEAIGRSEDFAREAADEFDERVDRAKTRLEAGWKAISAAAGDPVEAMSELEDGDRMVLQAGIDVAGHAGVGGGGGNSVGVEVERKGDDYVAKFHIAPKGKLGVGGGVSKKGVSADGVLELGGRIEVRARGPEGRRALEELMESPLDGGDLESRLRASQHLELTRYEGAAQVGVDCEAGFGGVAENSTSWKLSAGEVYENGEGKAVGAIEISHSLGVNTPAVETDPDAAATAIKASIDEKLDEAMPFEDVEIPREVIEEAIEANGGLVGLDLSLKVSGRIESVGGERTTVTMVGEIGVGGKTHSIEGKATLTHHVDTDELQRLAETGEAGELFEGDFDWEVKTQTADFHGFEIRNSPFTFRNGVVKVEETVLTTSEPRTAAGPVFGMHQGGLAMN